MRGLSWLLACLLLSSVGCVAAVARPDAGEETIRFASGTWQVEVRQEGLEVGIYTLERNFDTGLAEVGRSTWMPSGGVSEKQLFGVYPAPFGGKFIGGSGSVVGVVGVGGSRTKVDIRFVSSSGLVRFRGQEEAVSCDSDGSLYTFSGSDDHVVWMSWLDARTCLPTQKRCSGPNFWGSQLDGGDVCLMGEFQFPDTTEFARVEFHPWRRIAGYRDLAFVAWDENGSLISYATDAGVSRFAKFWPTIEGDPTRLGGLLTVVDGGVVGGLFRWRWTDAGVVQTGTPISRWMDDVDYLIEVPSGVIVQGRQALGLNDSRSAFRSVLVDRSGERVLGEFRGLPTVFVEGKYYRVLRSQEGGSDGRRHAVVTVELADLIPID